MGIRWAASAARHQIDRDDALNAILRLEAHLPAFDDPRVAGGRRPDLFIGPTRDRTQMLEVMAEVTPPGEIFVFHVMVARRRILDLIEGHSE